MAEITQKMIEAAGNRLFAAGRDHGWWSSSFLSYETLDPIGRDEFDAIVADILQAALTSGQQK